MRRSLIIGWTLGIPERECSSSAPHSFPGKPALSDMITVVTGVDHVGIVHNTLVVKKLKNIINGVIDRLKRTEPRPMEVIIAFDLSVTLSG